ncbi:MAG TPA: hypothetical protein VHA73_04910 [Acidimicrobiales bacterium]|jgi:hypothetical protein|nr:hypothetical protein [Acidimicrobiales bacterium]
MTDHTEPLGSGAPAGTPDLASLLADPPAGLVDRLTAMIASHLGPLVVDSVRAQLSAGAAAGAATPAVLELEVSEELLEQLSGAVRIELDRTMGDLSREVSALRDQLDRIEQRLGGETASAGPRVVSGQATFGQAAPGQ